MAELFITFGLQYGDLADADAAFLAGRVPKDPHPSADWATSDGYLTVEYALSVTDLQPEYIAEARERARQAAWAWLGGHYAFDYDEKPTLADYPRGEIGRMVLP